MVHFVGAGPGAPDLITQRGAALLRAADVVIYAGSLVNPALLGLCRQDCSVYNSAQMTLEQVLEVVRAAHAENRDIVRLHTGDPCLYGAIREQMDALDALGIPYDDTPGVSSFCGAAAAACAEYTLPGVSQTVIITRMAGRTPVPEREGIAALAAHGATMVVFLSAGMLDGLQAALLQGAYTPDTPAALVYKATWPEEKVVRCRLGALAQAGRENNISKTALVLVGDFLAPDYERSKLYDPSFATEFREAKPGPCGCWRSPKRAWSWPGGWRRSYPARPRAAAKAARWTPGQPTPLPTRTRLSMWARRASRCAPSRLMPGIRRRTRPWWRWTNAAASRCRC